MKKTRLLIIMSIILSLGLLISACGQKVESLEITSKNIDEQEETFITELKIPVIAGVKNQETMQAMNESMENDILKYKADTEASSKENHAEAKANGYELSPGYAGSIFKERYNQDNILSLTVTLLANVGGAHPDTYQSAYNFDLSDGKNLMIKDVLNETQLDKVNEIIGAQIKADAEDKMYYDDVVQNFEGIRADQGFYFQDKTLVVFFDLYEIAPYVVGIPEFKINFTDIDFDIKKI